MSIQQIDSVATAARPDSEQAVPRIALGDLSAATFYREHRVASRPLIITGAFDGVPRWTLDTLVEHLGEERFGVRFYGEDYRNRPKREWKNYCSYEAVAFREYAGMLRDGRAGDKHAYMAQAAIGHTSMANSIRPVFERLEQACDMTPIVAGQDMNLWLGPGGHSEALHFDTGDGTLMQLYGSKTVHLFPPSQTPNVYPFPFQHRIPPWVSQVDIDQPDHGVFPGFREAQQHQIDVTIHEGEILFIPMHWWHEVTALGDEYVCSINRFWKVRPVRRNFTSSRSTVFYLMNFFPWGAVVRFDDTVKKLRQKVGLTARAATEE